MPSLTSRRWQKSSVPPERGLCKWVVPRLPTCVFALVVSAACGTGPKPPPVERPTLRVGVGGLPSQLPTRGIQQFVSNMSNEGLLRVNREGRLEPWLADGWERSPDGLTLVIKLRRHVVFHDGSPLKAADVATILNESLPKAVKSAFDDVESITATSDTTVQVRFRRPSRFVADSMMDTVIQAPRTSGLGTGPFKRSPTNNAGEGPTEMVANEEYYLGRPNIDKITVTAFPNVRAAWAEMLRNQLDMLYEVSTDALPQMERSSNVAVYSFDRPYQYVLFLNAKNPKLKSADVRKALNLAVDRQAIVRDVLDGHGTPSAGAISPHNWAFDSAAAR